MRVGSYLSLFQQSQEEMFSLIFCFGVLPAFLFYKIQATSCHFYAEDPDA